VRSWFSRLSRRQRIVYGLGGGVALLAIGGTLWVAGAFGGGGAEEAIDERCEEQTPAPTSRVFSATRSPSPTPCPSEAVTRPTRSPRPSRSSSPTPTPSASPSPSPTPKATACCPTPPPTPPLTDSPTPVPETPVLGPIRLVQDIPGATFDRMVDFALIPGKPDEAIVVLQKAEQIWRASLSGSFTPTLYGDLSAYVGGGGEEEGLLSATVSPNFPNDGRIYVYYTQGGGSNLPTVLSRFQVDGNAMLTGSETRILEVPDFAINHNGGRILFGPESPTPYLYLSTGDGGGGGDPNDNGQKVDSWLGKVLRLNVTGQATYLIPADNPFVGRNGADEIWAYGFRNPWRFSFDKPTKQLWLGDVGQGNWEEVDVVRKEGNYGWNCMEGESQYDFTGCTAGAYDLPRAVYSTHEGGSCAITGGYVYRGSAMPDLVGRYIYGDYCSGKIWAIDSGNPTPQPVLLIDTSVQISSFAETPDGELLVLTFNNAIFRLSR